MKLDPAAAAQRSAYFASIRAEERRGKKRPKPAAKPVAKSCPVCRRRLRRKYRRVEVMGRTLWRPFRSCATCKIVVVLHRMPNKDKIW